VFGQKDAQQALVIRRMTRDLNFPTEIIVGPTVREADGLAVSSRNTYLSASERRAATGIHRGLTRAAEAFKAGERDASALVGSVRREIIESGGRVDYVECRRNDDLREVTRIEEAALLTVAAFYGKARLIDNVVLTP
jgi:pantoate--beta-alanine ligase